MNVKDGKNSQSGKWSLHSGKGIQIKEKPLCVLMKTPLETFNFVVSMLSSKSGLQDCVHRSSQNPGRCSGVSLSDEVVQQGERHQQHKNRKRTKKRMEPIAGSWERIVPRREEAGEGTYGRNKESISRAAQIEGKAEVRSKGTSLMAIVSTKNTSSGVT